MEKKFPKQQLLPYLLVSCLVEISTFTFYIHRQCSCGMCFVIMCLSSVSPDNSRRVQVKTDNRFVLSELVVGGGYSYTVIPFSGKLCSLVATCALLFILN